MTDYKCSKWVATFSDQLNLFNRQITEQTTASDKDLKISMVLGSEPQRYKIGTR